MIAAQTETREVVPIAFTIEPIDYAFTKAEIVRQAEAAKLLIVTDPDDKDGLKQCHGERMKLRKMRTTIEAKRKSLKADSIEYGNKVDSSAKELIAPIEEAEAHLQEQENIVKREQERIAKEEQEKRQAVIAERCRLIEETGKMITAVQVAAMTDEQFQAALAEATAAKKTRDEKAAAEAAERERVAAEQKAQADRLAMIGSRMTALAPTGVAWCDGYGQLPQADWDRTLSHAVDEKHRSDEKAAADRAEIERVKKEQSQAQEKIDAEEKRQLMNRRLDHLGAIKTPCGDLDLRQILFDAAGIPKTGIGVAEMSEADFGAAAGKLRTLVEDHEQHLRESAEAEEKERIAEQDRVAAAEKEYAEAVERERQRIEALRPDHEKLLAVADAVEAIVVPECDNSSALSVLKVRQLINVCADDIRKIANDLIS